MSDCPFCHEPLPPGDVAPGSDEPSAAQKHVARCSKGGFMLTDEGHIVGTCDDPACAIASMPGECPTHVHGEPEPAMDEPCLDLTLDADDYEEGSAEVCKTGHVLVEGSDHRSYCIHCDYVE